jgi:AraC-like DNA-binding protein
MSPVCRAIWYVESHFARDVTDDIALGSGVSACHLTRAFAAATGRSVMRYLRARRLSEAARTPARGGWAPRNLERVWSAVGEGGQRLFVMPGVALAVATSAGNYGADDQWIPPMRVMREVVLASIA